MKSKQYIQAEHYYNALIDSDIGKEDQVQMAIQNLVYIEKVLKRYAAT